MSASICNIFDFSDEILMKIIYHLNARERAWLGNTCMKFYGLVFREKRFIRNLDFSEDGYLVSSADVRQYFKDVTMYQHMRSINLGNMCCSKPEPMLQDIKKATNLVELNIIGIRFIDFSDFKFLLDPLEKLEKLSVGWPEDASPNPADGATLKKSFNRLKHLTVRVDDFNLVLTFLPVLFRYSQQLEELFVLLTHFGVSSFDVTYLNEFLDGLESVELPKLKIAAGYNINHHRLALDELFAQILPDSERWTQFHGAWHGLLYYEKDVNVTREMCSHVRMHDWDADGPYVKRTQYLVPGQLLAHAAKVATGAAAKNFDCLLQNGYSVHPVMLTIEDIKALLQNPRHQVSYIHMEHDLGPTCLAYLSAFPDLTHLVLYGIIKGFPIPYNSAKVERKHKDSDDLNRTVSANTVFRKLVESTPHLKNFVLTPSFKVEKDPWDLPALNLISRWKELTTLFLAKIPIVNGEFLVEIGKKCENLQTLRLEEIGPYSYFCYKNELSQMLTHCHNLKDFSIVQDTIGQVSDMFTMFARNPRLQRLRIKSFGRKNTFENIILSVETLIRSHKMVLLWCEFDSLNKATRDNLRLNIQKLKEELHRTTFEFRIIDEWEFDGFLHRRRTQSLEYAHTDLLLSQSLSNALYQLGC